MVERVRIQCPRCSTRLSLSDAAKLGKKVRCPKCEDAFVAKAIAEDALPSDDPSEGDPFDLTGVEQDDPATAHAFVQQRPARERRSKKPSASGDGQPKPARRKGRFTSKEWIRFRLPLILLASALLVSAIAGAFFGGLSGALWHVVFPAIAIGVSAGCGLLAFEQIHGVFDRDRDTAASVGCKFAAVMAIVNAILDVCLAAILAAFFSSPTLAVLLLLTFQAAYWTLIVPVAVLLLSRLFFDLTFEESIRFALILYVVVVMSTGVAYGVRSFTSSAPKHSHRRDGGNRRVSTLPCGVFQPCS